MEERQVKLLNVGLLGLAFMLVFTAFQTLGNVQPIILDSARNESSGGYVDGLFIFENFNSILIKLYQLFSYFFKGFTGDGFLSAAVIYAVFTFANWFAPPVVSFLGPRITLISMLNFFNEHSCMVYFFLEFILQTIILYIVGGVCYALFIAQLIYPNNILLYGASALVGIGAALIWVAQVFT